MKRVKAACITQTLHFLLKEDLGHDYAVKLVNEEVKRYINKALLAVNCAESAFAVVCLIVFI